MFKNEIINIIEYKKSLLNKIKLFDKDILKISKLITSKIKKGGTLFICGNGGSAADAQHLAAEMLVRLRPNVNRRPLPAISLAQDTSTITACGNDYDFNQIFTRNLEALGTNKDILLAISTSGNSSNIINVLKFAKKKKISSIGLLGNGGGKSKRYCQLNIIVPSKITARIQEIHIFLGHLILEKVENLLIKKN